MKLAIYEKEKAMKINRKVSITGVLAILVSASTAIAQEGRWPGHSAPNKAVLYEFANISDLPTLAEGPVKETCSHYAVPPADATKAKPPAKDEEVRLAEDVTKELTKRLEKEIPVVVAPEPDIPALGSLVFTGCFVTADRGNGAKRLVGVGLGASHLAAHVRVFYIGTSGPVPVDEFDLSVKGSNKLPPLGAAGLTLNAVSEKRETLQADAKHLADDILKKLKKDHRIVDSDDGLLVEAGGPRS
jgi:hypothetical protein